MKRLLVALLAAVVLAATVFPAAAFAISGSPPYSQSYLKDIEGSRYVRFENLNPYTSEEFSYDQRTIEMYDVITLSFRYDDWEDIVDPFRTAFKNAGFDESVHKDDNGQNEYWFLSANESGGELFRIIGEKAAQAVMNESGLVYVIHEHFTVNSTSKPEQTMPSTPAAPTMTPQQAADALHELGLFNGTGTDANGNPKYDLDRAPTRNEAVTMLVRLLGKEKVAQGQTWASPFTDVPQWAKLYIGYAYSHGLTSGTSLDKFNGSSPVTASQYITFVLRALGYRDGTDFQWNRAWELSDKLGITSGEYDELSGFTRGDVALISYRALQANQKGSNNILMEISQSSTVNERSASVDDIEAVLDEVIAGMELKKAALESSLDDTNSATTWDEIAESLRKEQAQFRVVANHFRTAANLCQDFSDLQNLKQYLFDRAALYSAICNYNIVGTEESAWKYSDLHDTLSEQEQVIQTAIEREIDRWIENYS